MRELERQLAALCRKSAVRTAEGRKPRLRVTTANLRNLLGQPRFQQRLQIEHDSVAAANAVIANSWGGELMPVEISVAQGDGELVLTGQMDDVLKESAQAARTYWRVRAGSLGINRPDFDALSFHVHIPAGAQPKSGASVGLSIAVAMNSALTGRAVRADTVLTGEISLQGRVIRTSDVKAKVLAAGRAGLSRFILPRGNRQELEEVPEGIRAGIDFVLVDSVEDVMTAALVGA